MLCAQPRLENRHPVKLWEGSDLFSDNGSYSNNHYVYFDADNIFVNPYGTRCLENLYTQPNDTDARDKLYRKLDRNERDKLYDTIEHAFKNQELVPMPDFRKLGKGGKDIID